ncbi:MAG: iron hydrogenase small subunit [Clostridia bacterium]|nr:iron hydrogenase small subunit [Clostridia bacterium]
MLNININGIDVKVEQGSTILEAANKIGVKIPTLCHIPEIQKIGACRMCLVDIEGNPKLQASCTTPVVDGMKIRTNTKKVRDTRKFVLELILSDHPTTCLTCERNTRCELQSMAAELGIDIVPYRGATSSRGKDNETLQLNYDGSKCIYCKRCETMCNEVQTVGAIFSQKRGFNSEVGTPFNVPFKDSVCTGCGQCVLNCPVSALKDNENIDEVWEAIQNPEIITVVQVAPSVRVTLGEEFGLKPGSIVTGKIFAAMRRIGFDHIFDTDFAADLTIMEEGHEFIHRVKNGGTLPMITSCSPGWVNFIETFFPDLLPNLSTCKSPQQMQGAMVKTYFAEKMGLDPKKICSISVMPCTAKKGEAKRPEMGRDGYSDVDIAITTREFAKMIRQAEVEFLNLPDEGPDDPIGISTGAGLIFGASGGVMEAALRTALEVIEGHEIENIDYEAVRGLKLDGVKEATVSTKIDGNDVDVKVAVASGLGNARKLMEKIQAGEADYHFIEIMACPGGCIGGGGQPIPTTTEIRKQRIEGIYKGDKDMPIRKSHLNPAIQVLYKEFLGEPNGHKAHEYLHTHYHHQKYYDNLK